MSKIRAFTNEQWGKFIENRRYNDKADVGKGRIVCEFCRERNVEFTFAHDGYSFMTDTENHIYLLCGPCFFHNIKYFLDFINAKI